MISKLIKDPPEFVTDVTRIDRLHSGLTAVEIAASHAHSALGNIFEDIFCGAYNDAYEMLSGEEKVKLLCLAAVAPGSHLHIEWILAELLRLNHPLSLDVFKRLASTFDCTNPFINESISQFILSLIGCERFLPEPPEMRCGDRPDEHAWLLIGQIIFWNERRKTDAPRANRRLCELWAEAQGSVACAMPDVLQHLHRGMLRHLGMSPLDLLHLYPDEIRPILECALCHADLMSSLWFTAGVTNWDAIHFTISALSEIGNRNSADLLEKFVESPTFGDGAVRAVRTLRGRYPR